MTQITQSERFVLEWLGRTEFSQYGECGGAALDSLVAKSLAQIHGPGEHQSGFIARGEGLDYRAVSLTPAGREALHANL